MHIDPREISFGTLTYNRFSFLCEYVKSLFETTDAVGELIIIDRCSSDKTEDYFNSATLTYGAQYIREKRSCNRAKGWNKLIKLAKCDWVFCSHDDVYFLDNWTDHLKDVSNKCLHILFGGYHAFMIHKDAIPLFGEFDENFVDGKFEDYDFYMRWENDLDLVKTIPYSECGNVHNYLESRSEVTAQYGKLSLEYFMRKHGYDPRPILVKKW